MNLLRLAGVGLVASSVYFLWIFALAGVLVVYGLLTGDGGSGPVDFAGNGFNNIVFKNALPGVMLLTAGMVLVRNSTIRNA